MLLQHHIHINKPIRQVFQYFVTVENLVDWIEGLHYFEVLEGEEAAVGGKSKQIIKQSGRTLEFVQVITGLEENRLFEAKMEGKEMNIAVRYLFEEIEEGTKLSVVQEVKLKSFLLRSAKAVAKPLMENVMKNDFITLKNILENE